uniref:Uncharacterized protein n=1 Tax=Parascaris equorum TaxID=6256 RepID=A0A914R6Z2_PAREQ
MTSNMRTLKSSMCRNSNAFTDLTSFYGAILCAFYQMFYYEDNKLEQILPLNYHPSNYA